MARKGSWQIALVTVLGIALLAAVVVIVYQFEALTQVKQQRDANLKLLRETRVALRETERRLEMALAKPPAPRIDLKAVIAQRNATIKQLNHELSQAHISLKELQGQLAAAKKESQEKLAGAKEDNQKLQAKWKSRLATMTQQMDATQTALQDAHQRVAGLEAANSRLRKESNRRSARAAERERILSNLQDLDRRREAYLSSITDRCRDIINRFRAMSGMLDSNRQQDSSAFSGSALDLIENAISLTDSDLQHLSDLNAKAFRLEKQLSKM